MAYPTRCPSVDPNGEYQCELGANHGGDHFSKTGLLGWENKPPADQASAVDHPSHYGGDTTYEVIKVIEAWELDKDGYLFNVVKYVARAGKKDKARELEDLKKAAWYLDRKIKRLEAK